MIVIGLICLIVGFVLAIPLLWEIGVVVLVVGLILEVLARTGRSSRHYW